MIVVYEKYNNRTLVVSQLRSLSAFFVFQTQNLVWNQNNEGSRVSIVGKRKKETT